MSIDDDDQYSIFEPTRRQPASSALVRAAEADTARERASRGATANAFDESDVFIATDLETGRMIMNTDSDGRWMRVYSDANLIPGFKESEISHTWRKGARLLDELPFDVGVVLDPGKPHQRVIRYPRATPKVPEQAPGETE